MNFFTSLYSALAGSATGVDRLAAAVTAMGTTITDGKMWRSLGWLLLGIALMVLGLFWLIRGPINGKIDAARAAAAKAA